MLRLSVETVSNLFADFPYLISPYKADHLIFHLFPELHRISHKEPHGAPLAIVLVASAFSENTFLLRVCSCNLGLQALVIARI